MGYADSGIPVIVPSLPVMPAILPDASKIEAAETGVLSVASITRCWARVWLENRSMPAARIKNLFIVTLYYMCKVTLNLFNFATV